MCYNAECFRQYANPQWGQQVKQLSVGPDPQRAIKCDRNGSCAASIYLVKVNMRTFPDLREHTQESQLRRVAHKHDI
jgi:hypothetical protein